MTETTVTLSLGSFDWGPLALATKSILGLIAANFVLGVAAAIKTRTFDVQKLPGFLIDDVLPGLVALLLVAIGIVTEAEYVVAIGLAAVAAVAGPLLLSIKDATFVLFGKLPEPPAA